MSTSKIKRAVRAYVDATLAKPTPPKFRRAIIKGAFSVIRRCGLARLEVYTLDLKSAGW